MSDKAIQHWAREANIPVTLVQTGRITLNHDDGRLAKLTSGKATPPFAALDRAEAVKAINIEQLDDQA